MTSPEISMPLKTNEKNRIFPIVGYAAIIALAILWASTAFATTEELSHQCSDGRYVVDTGTPDCPTALSGTAPGANLQDTSTDVQSTLDQTGGTVYRCVYLDTATPPSFEQIVAGTDGDDVACVSAANSSASSTAYSSNVTGLTAATDYLVSVAVLSASGKRSLVSTSQSFTTTGGAAPGGDDLTNSGTFVGCGVGASDSNNGTSHAQRLASLPTGLAVGANVYLETDCVWEDTKWAVNWSGTSGDRVEINTYCVDTSDSNKPKAWTSGGTGCGAKAEINGTYEIDAGGCAADGYGADCEYALSGTNSSAVPTSQYQGLLEVTAPYVTIENVAIHDSAGDGLYIKENVSGQSHFIGRGIEIDGTLKRAVHVGNAVAGGNAFFDDITMTMISLQIPHGLGGTWSGCVSFDSSNATINSGIVMQNSSLVNCGGEGYSTLRIGNVVFRDNYGANFNRVAMFPDASQNVVYERMHIVLADFPGTSATEAFVTAVECYGPSGTFDSTGHVLRDSLITGVDSDSNFIRVAIEGNGGCPEPWRSQGYDPRTEGFVVGVEVYGNTVLAESGATMFACTVCPSDTMIFKNNYFAGSSSTFNVPTAAVFDYNYWDSAPSDADAQGANDVYGGGGLSNNSAWDADNPSSLSDANLPPGSSALNAGTPLTAPLLDISNYANFNDFSDGCILTEAQWEQTSYADVNCTARDASTPNIGAWEGTP